MLVYAAAFRLKNGAERDELLQVVARWLTKKEVPKTPGDALKGERRFQYRSGGRLEIVIAGDAPELYSLRYVHRDAETAGRDWFTEIGVAQPSDGTPLMASIVVRTDEISSRVTQPIHPSRPAVVTDLASAGLMAPDTPGLELLTLDDEYAAEGLRYSLENINREFPYVIVSATPDGHYFVDPEHLRTVVVGLAEVVRIPPEANTYRIAEVLGKEFAAWRGGVNVVLPPSRRPDLFIPTVRLIPDVLSKFSGDGRRADGEILAAVTHRTNPVHFAKHISPGKVRDVKQLRELARRKTDAKKTGELTQWADLLEQENTQIRADKESLEAQLLDDRLAHDDDLSKLRYQLDSVKAQLDQLAAARNSGSTRPLEEIRECVIAAIRRDITPEEALQLVSSLFPERIEILPSAYKSAKQSRDFKYRNDNLDLLLKLATDYYLALTSGKGDVQARQIFGKAFSAHDSDRVEGNRRARDLRTFEYQGLPIEMMEHLKIGVKPSAAETIRIHFTWRSEEGKILVGYCGPHLDHK